jgi:CHASE2 domain-containing sensor protein
MNWKNMWWSFKISLVCVLCVSAIALSSFLMVEYGMYWPTVLSFLVTLTLVIYFVNSNDEAKDNDKKAQK